MTLIRDPRADHRGFGSSHVSVFHLNLWEETRTNPSQVGLLSVPIASKKSVFMMGFLLPLFVQAMTLSFISQLSRPRLSLFSYFSCVPSLFYVI